MWPNPQETVDLVTFTEEIFNGKLHFLCSNEKAPIFYDLLQIISLIYLEERQMILTENFTT